MNMITNLPKLTASFGFLFLLSACGSNGSSGSSSATGKSASDSASLLKVDNLADQQQISQGVPTQFRITTKPEIDSVVVSSNGHELGHANLGRDAAKKFHFETTFTGTGDQDITFEGFAAGTAKPLATTSFRVHVVRPTTPPPGSLFNAYILKAVDYLNKNYGLLGYNINSQITHPIQYYKFGTFEPTGKGMTMCVAGTLEVIMTAFDIYSKETGDYSIYNYLGFSSWSTLSPSTIKAQIWVDPKLHSSGTADAIAHFGLGQHVAFKDLKAGGFININRTTGSGHSVTFLSFIDKQGNDVAEYNDSVVGFRYFGSQGHGEVGKGGFSFRHAFFSKYGCPDVPYQRDCNVILSDDQRLLNVGEILDPKLWKKPAETDVDVEQSPLAPADQALVSNPLDWNGLTTDD